MIAKLFGTFNKFLAVRARRKALELNCKKCVEIKEISAMMRFHVCEKHNCEDYQGAWEN